MSNRVKVIAEVLFFSKPFLASFASVLQHGGGFSLWIHDTIWIKGAHGVFTIALYLASIQQLYNEVSIISRTVYFERHERDVIPVSSMPRHRGACKTLRGPSG